MAMVVEYDPQRQRLVVRDHKGTVMLTVDEPSAADVEYWQQAARQRGVVR